MIKFFRKDFILILLLAAVFLCSFALRTIKLSDFPVGFQIDEASLGWNAYSILQTGKSEAGIKLPLYIDTFGDNRPTGYNYVDIPFIAFLGLTVFATRLPGAVFGALSVFPVFLLAYALFKNKKIALLSAVLVTISPWNVVLSRASAETIIALFFILFGFFFLFHFIRSKKTWEVLVGTLLLGLSFFFYHTPRVFVPMYFFVALLVLTYPYKNIKAYKELSKLIVSFLLLCILSFSLIFLIKGGTGRFTQVNIFGFPETKLVMAEQIREDGSDHAPLFTTRLFHNKVVNYSLTFVTNYFAYFSGDFLFTRGGLPIWYQVDQTGLLLLVESPFVLYGVYLCVKSKNRFAKLPLFWILVAPITAAITVDDIPNLQRAIVLFPMLEIIGAVGLFEFLNRISKIKSKIFRIPVKQVIFVFCFLIFLFNFLYFLHQYFVHGEKHRTWYRNNGFADMMQVVNKNYSSYDKVVATKTGGGYPLFLFFSKYDPKTYQQEGSPKDADYKGFGKYIFIPNECPSINLSVNLPKGTKILYVDRGTCPEPSKKSGRKFQNIYREDGSLAFRIIF
ncbi:MAG: glycosyltransferase family 39 protein [Candidatus Levyibacteriota bacterium]